MEFLKNHYEKVILGITVLILAATAAWLFAATRSAQESVSNVETTLPPVQKIPVLDVSEYKTNLSRVKNPPRVNLSEGHNLFNPVTWKRKPDGSLMKITSGNEEGPAAVRVIKVQPLNMTIAVDRVAAGSATFSITREAIPNPSLRRVQRYISASNTRTEFFHVVEMKPPDNPEEWVLELTSDKQRVTVTKAQPFTRIEAYSADLRYEPENRNFLDVRVNQNINLGGEAYKIVAITENEVRLAAISTGKQFTIKVQK